METISVRSLEKFETTQTGIFWMPFFIAMVALGITGASVGGFFLLKMMKKMMM